MSTSQLLDELLTSLGYPPVIDLRSAAAVDFCALGGTLYDGDLALFEPLRRRRWCAHFDSEGQFFKPQEHSRLIAALLTLAGVDPLPEMRDTWLSNAGWVMEIRNGARHVAYHLRVPGRDIPSDYCELWLVRALLNDWLAPERMVVDIPTGDQTAFCCLMPPSVYKELCDWGVIVRDEIDGDKEEQLRPSPDSLVLWPSRNVAEYMEDVVKLTAQQTDAMLKDTSSNWFRHR